MVGSILVIGGILWIVGSATSRKPALQPVPIKKDSRRPAKN